MVNIGALILAAGKSTRMGKPKLLLPFKGAPLITHPVSLAIQNQLQPIVCITGGYEERLTQALTPFHENITINYNPHYESGMASSLKEGIHALQGKVDAVIIFLGDQPLVPNKVIQTIIQEYKANKENAVKIVRPIYDQQFGHPILFDSGLFHEFEALHGDEGGKGIIQQYKDYLKLIHFPNSDWGIDIDTPEEYLTLLKRNDGI